MGSVADPTASGEEESLVAPVHYLYCDQCGSFRIDGWPESEGRQRRVKLQRRLAWVAGLSLLSTVVSVAVALFSVIAGAVAEGRPAGGLETFLWMGLSLAVWLVAYPWVKVLEAKTRFRGVRCGHCGTIYEYGTPFFTGFQSNPRNYTMADVPRPLASAYRMLGDGPGPARTRQATPAS